MVICDRCEAKSHYSYPVKNYILRFAKVDNDETDLGTSEHQLCRKCADHIEKQIKKALEPESKVKERKYTLAEIESAMSQLDEKAQGVVRENLF